MEDRDPFQEFLDKHLEEHRAEIEEGMAMSDEELRQHMVIE